VIESFLIDDFTSPETPRHEVREKLAEALARPAGLEEAAEYDRAAYQRKLAVEAAAAARQPELSDSDNPFLAMPKLAGGGDVS
jgi:hypothetical protein